MFVLEVQLGEDDWEVYGIFSTAANAEGFAKELIDTSNYSHYTVHETRFYW